MKTTNKLLAAAVILGGAYTATSWWLGGQIEQQYAAWLDQASQQFDHQLNWQRSYSRGIFSSTQDWTLEIPLDTDASSEQQQPITIKLHSDIQHGPFADGQLATAVDRTRVESVDGLPQELLDNVQLNGTLTVTTTQDLRGAWHSRIAVPGGQGQWEPDEEEGEDKVSVQWEPATASLEGELGHKNVQGSLQWPTLQVDLTATESIDGRLAVTDWKSRFKLDLDADGWLLAPGHLSATVDQVTLTERPADTASADSRTIFSMRNVEYDLDRSASDEHVNLQQNTKASGQLGDMKLEQLVSEQKLERLDKQALRQLQPMLLALLAAEDVDEAIDDDALEAVIERLMDAGPSYAEQTRATLDGAEGHANWAVALAPKSADGPLAGMQLPPQFELLGRLSGEAQLLLPQSWLSALADAEDMSVNELRDQLDELVEDGFLHKEDGAYTLDGKYEQGKLTVNGETLFDLR